MKFYAAKPVLEEYFTATSVEEALAYLIAYDGDAQIVAGGTYLMPQLQTGECGALRLVDISRISALSKVWLEGADLYIGGATTFAKLVKSEALSSRCLLRQAATRLGTASIRRLATLGGNLVSAEGNAEGGVALIALGAEAEITNVTGAQWLPVASLYVRPGLSRVDSTTEIVTAIRFPALVAGEGGAIETLGEPEPSEWPEATIAMLIVMDDDGRNIQSARVVVGIAGQIPHQMNAVEAFLGGASPDDPHTQQEMLRLLVEECEPYLSEAEGIGIRRIAGTARKAYENAVEGARASQGSQ